MKRCPTATCLFIGNRDGPPDGHGACAAHNPGYDFNDANVPVGAACRVLLTEHFLVA